MSRAAVQFAETAREAWAPPATFKAQLRSGLRHAALSLAATVTPASQSFVRCLYAHAVFPEQRQAFRDTIRSLKDVGQFIGTAELLDMIHSGKAPDGRYFHLSFDDGFANVFEVGCDVLADERVPATIFVATSLVEAPAEALPQFFGRMSAYRQPLRIMTWAQVREAAAAGFEIGSHTQSHARLSAISGDAGHLMREIGASRALLAERSGTPCRSFAWPYGTLRDIDEAGFAAIRTAGYEVAFSAVRGRVTAATDVLCVPRHQIEFHWPKSHIRLWASGFGEA